MTRKILISLIGFLMVGFFMHGSSSWANIVLKVVAVNPSRTQVQSAQVKAYLPKEVKENDVLDMGNLSIAYDNQQGSYFVYGEYELNPLDVFEQDIELVDVWTIPEDEMLLLIEEAQKIQGLLSQTDFRERADFLLSSVQSRLAKIMAVQKNPAPNPERHISDYRDNLKIFDDIKSDMALARSFLSQVKPLSMAMIWRMIVMIVVFLGILGCSFYMLWKRQIKPLNEESAYYVPQADQPSSAPESTGSKNPDSPSKD